MVTTVWCTPRVLPKFRPRCYQGALLLSADSPVVTIGGRAPGYPRNAKGGVTATTNVLALTDAASLRFEPGFNPGLLLW